MSSIAMGLQWFFSVVFIGVSITLADDNTFGIVRSSLTGNADPAAPAPELVARNNYMVEIHHVKTQDDYILEMHRIPGSPECPTASRKRKPVVFLMHGLFCSSADWLLLGPRRSIAYLLADAGYDVWLGNARGNTYSINHSRPISEKEFWGFSFHEIGYYDLPAMIDYALEETGQEQMVYIGHSQGTTAFYVMASMRPEYNVKIKVMISLAPVAYTGSIFNPYLRSLSLWIFPIEAFFNRIGVHQVFASPGFVRKAGARGDTCSDRILGKIVCRNIIFLLGGFDSPQLDVDLLPLVFGHFPASASVRQFIHFGQELVSRKFRPYDFGEIENRRKYGSAIPPSYNLSSVTAPVHLYYSGNDWLSAEQDVTQLFRELGNPIEMFRVPYPKWEHFDYLYGTDARTLVYEPILNTLAKSYGLPASCSRLNPWWPRVGIKSRRSKNGQGIYRKVKESLKWSGKSRGTPW